jgi:hypothetical protein
MYSYIFLSLNVGSTRVRQGASVWCGPPGCCQTKTKDTFDIWNYADFHADEPAEPTIETEGPSIFLSVLV